MKLTIKQDNLAKALSSIGRIATARAGLPILANVLIHTDGNTVIISATNLEIAITTTIVGNVEEQGALTVPARLLTDFVNNLPHTDVKIETEETKFNISAAGYKSTINSILADDYPALPEVTEDNKFAITASELKKAINGTAPIACKDVTRPVLTGVYFYTDDDGLAYMVATDGYRLAEDKITKLDAKLSAIVPSTTLLEVMRQLSDNDDEVTIKYNDEQMTFEVGNTSITSRLIDGKFISYQQIIPTSADFTVVVDRAELIKTTRMAELFASVTAGTVIVEGDPSKKTLSVRSITSQLGDNISSIEADIEASGDTACTVNVNSKYLMEALNCLTGDKVTLKFSGRMTPVLLTGADDNYLHIVMPVK